jgi:hypothetical protein
MLRVIGIILIIGIIIIFVRKKDVISDMRQWLQQPIKVQFKSVRRASLWLIAMSGLILALTGLLPFLLLGAPMSGFMLLIHVAVSPIFIAGIVVLAVVSAETHRFDDAVRKTIRTWWQLREISLADGGYNVWRKVLFWLIVIATLMLGSIVLSMYPLFDSVGMDFFLTLHKFAALLMLVTGVGYAFILMEVD